MCARQNAALRLRLSARRSHAKDAMPAKVRFILHILGNSRSMSYMLSSFLHLTKESLNETSLHLRNHIGFTIGGRAGPCGVVGKGFFGEHRWPKSRPLIDVLAKSRFYLNWHSNHPSLYSSQPGGKKHLLLAAENGDHNRANRIYFARICKKRAQICRRACKRCFAIRTARNVSL